MLGGFQSTILKGDPKIPGNKNKSEQNGESNSNSNSSDDSEIVKDKAIENVALKKDFGSLICKQASTAKKRRQICDNNVISSEAATESDKCFKNFCQVCC